MPRAAKERSFPAPKTMRAIGQLPSAAQAQTFGDHLIAHKIRNEVEEDGGVWIIWIRTRIRLRMPKRASSNF